MEVRPVGVLNMVDQDEPDQKCWPYRTATPGSTKYTPSSSFSLTSGGRSSTFFTIYKELEGKRTEMRGWKGPQEAREAIQRSRERYLELHP